MPTVGRKYSGKASSYIQSVRFLKSSWTEERAKEWCKNHNYKLDGLDITDNEFRFRQYDPEDSKYRYRKGDTIDGRYYIFGFKK